MSSRRGLSPVKFSFKPQCQEDNECQICFTDNVACIIFCCNTRHICYECFKRDIQSIKNTNILYRCLWCNRSLTWSDVMNKIPNKKVLDIFINDRKNKLLQDELVRINSQYHQILEIKEECDVIKKMLTLLNKKNSFIVKMSDFFFKEVQPKLNQIFFEVENGKYNFGNEAEFTRHFNKQIKLLIKTEFSTGYKSVKINSTKLPDEFTVIYNWIINHFFTEKKSNVFYISTLLNYGSNNFMVFKRKLEIYLYQEEKNFDFNHLITLFALRYKNDKRAKYKIFYFFFEAYLGLSICPDYDGVMYFTEPIKNMREGYIVWVKGVVDDIIKYYQVDEPPSEIKMVNKANNVSRSVNSNSGQTNSVNVKHFGDNVKVIMKKENKKPFFEDHKLVGNEKLDVCVRNRYFNGFYRHFQQKLKCDALSMYYADMYTFLLYSLVVEKSQIKQILLKPIKIDGRKNISVFIPFNTVNHNNSDGIKNTGNVTNNIFGRILKNINSMVYIEEKKNSLENEHRSLLLRFEHLFPFMLQGNKNLENSSLIKGQLLKHLEYKKIHLHKAIYMTSDTVCKKCMKGCIVDRQCNNCGFYKCENCLESVDDIQYHVCKDDVLANIRFIMRSDDTKQCPRCDEAISKVAGCNAMFCISCQNFFDFRSGHEIKPQHNPHYQEALQNGNYRSTSRVIELGSFSDNNNLLDLNRIVENYVNFLNKKKKSIKPITMKSLVCVPKLIGETFFRVVTDEFFECRKRYLADGDEKKLQASLFSLDIRRQRFDALSSKYITFMSQIVEAENISDIKKRITEFNSELRQIESTFAFRSVILPYNIRMDEDYVGPCSTYTDETVQLKRKRVFDGLSIDKKFKK